MAAANGTAIPVQYKLHTWSLEDETLVSLIVRPLSELESGWTDIESSARLTTRLVEAEGLSLISGLWILTDEGRTRAMNARGAQLLGYAPAEMTGRLYTDLFFPADESAISRVLEARPWREPRRHEFRLRRQDGSAMWASMEIHDLSMQAADESGTLIIFAGHHRAQACGTGARGE